MAAKWKLHPDITLVNVVKVDEKHLNGGRVCVGVELVVRRMLDEPKPSDDNNDQLIESGEPDLTSNNDLDFLQDDEIFRNGRATMGRERRK